MLQVLVRMPAEASSLTSGSGSFVSAQNSEIHDAHSLNGRWQDVAENTGVSGGGLRSRFWFFSDELWRTKTSVMQDMIKGLHGESSLTCRSRRDASQV